MAAVALASCPGADGCTGACAAIMHCMELQTLLSAHTLPSASNHTCWKFSSSCGMSATVMTRGLRFVFSIAARQIASLCRNA